MMKRTMQKIPKVGDSRCFVKARIDKSNNLREATKIDVVEAR